MNTHCYLLPKLALAPHSGVVSRTQRTTKPHSFFHNRNGCVATSGNQVVRGPPPVHCGSVAAQRHRQLPLVAGENRDAAAPPLATAMAAASARDTCRVRHQIQSRPPVYTTRLQLRHTITISWQGLCERRWRRRTTSHQFVRFMSGKRLMYHHGHSLTNCCMMKIAQLARWRVASWSATESADTHVAAMHCDTGQTRCGMRVPLMQPHLRVVELHITGPHAAARVCRPSGGGSCRPHALRHDAALDSARRRRRRAAYPCACVLRHSACIADGAERTPAHAASSTESLDASVPPSEMHSSACLRTAHATAANGCRIAHLPCRLLGAGTGCRSGPVGTAGGLEALSAICSAVAQTS